MEPFRFTRILAVGGGAGNELAYASLGAGTEVRLAGDDGNAESVFEEVARHRCDLVLARPRNGATFSREWLRQMLFESPCPVCIMPGGATLSLERALVRLSLTPRGSRLLSLAASLVHSAGGEELLAVHNSFDYDVDEQPGLAEGLRTRDELAIYRFLARASLWGVTVSPTREARPGEARALLGVARRRGAGLVIVDPGGDGGPVWQWNRREVLKVAILGEVAILSTGLSNDDRTWRRALGERVVHRARTEVQLMGYDRFP